MKIKAKFSKYLICSLVAVCMILAIPVLQSLDLPSFGVEAQAASVVDSGECGDDVTYTFDSDGLLTISGSGDMDWGFGNSPFHYVNSIKSVFIENGVTSIRYSAFEGCSSLTSITIPDSVTSIGYSAFEGCSSLTSITIPDSVMSIGYDAFYETPWLENQTENFIIINGILIDYKGTDSIITIPDSVTSIGDLAFEKCSSLTSITIPDSVTSIGYKAFYYCRSLTSITIADSVMSIGNEAFWRCSSLTIITIPDSVTSIGHSAFSYCSSLTRITIPDSVTSIGNGVFSNCFNLTRITIPYSVTSIGYSAFYGCFSLETVYYKGSSDQWNKIEIESDNEDLTSAERVYLLSPITTITPTIGWYSAILKWNAPINATGYNIQQYIDGKWKTIKVTYDANDTSIKVENLEMATTYYFKVYPFAKNGSQILWGESKTVKLTTNSNKKPAAISVTPTIGWYSTILKWNAPANATGYVVKQYVGNNQWKTIKTTYYGNDTSITVSNLKMATTYYFKVYPFAKSGTKIIWGDAKTVKLTTMSNKKPAALSTLSAKVGYVTTILNWKAPVGATGYNVQQYVNGKWKTIKVTYYGNDTTLTVSNLKMATTYYFKVYPFAKNGTQIIWGTPKTIKITMMSNKKPSAVTSINAKVGYVSTILTWKAPANATGYSVQQYLGNGKWKTVKIIRHNNETSATITGLKRGTSYYFRVLPFATNSSQYIWGTSVNKLIKTK